MVLRRYIRLSQSNALRLARGSERPASMFFRNRRSGYTRSSDSVPTTTAACRRRGLSGVANGTVGFIGLGNMGSCMAKNLAKAGHDVVLFDADDKKTASLATQINARAASSLQELAETSSSIITMLPNTPSVEAVYLGKSACILPGNVSNAFSAKTTTTTATMAAAMKEHVRTDEVVTGGILDWVQPGTLLVDSSTIDALASRRLNLIAMQKGATMIDAPVSGGVPAASNATLTFIVGGTKEGLEISRPLLMSMGANIVHCGEAGDGCIAKVCNNLCLAISMAGVSEAMALGSKMGMDPKVLANVLNSSTARCWSSEVYNPCPGVMEDVPSSRGFQGGFTASLMEKDLHLALQAAQKSSQSLPMGALAHQLYSLMCSQGNASKDFSGIYELLSPEVCSRRDHEGLDGGHYL